VRGGIVDVFPAESQFPVRIEFFGDEIDDIREYDPESQISIRKLKKAVIGWNTDTPLAENELKSSELKEKFEDYKREGFSLSPFWPLLFTRLTGLLENLSEKDVLIIVENFTKLEEQLKQYLEEVSNAVCSGFTPVSDVNSYFFNLDEVLSSLVNSGYIEIGKPVGRSAETPIIEIDRKTAGDRFLLGEFFKKSKRIFIVYGSDLNPEKLKRTAERYTEDSDVPVRFLPGYMRNGFFLKNEEILVVPAHFVTGAHIMLFEKKPVRVRVGETFDLSPGDLVVHPKYGIGRFEGISKELREGSIRELLVIEYRDGQIKIPVMMAESLTRYLGDEENVELDRISSPEWKKAREKAQKSARKLAFNLVSVYARRTLVRRKPYDVSNPWIFEFESLFPYDETLDQAAAINDVYQDMASEYPMERLIIGDVGYGKTEVAMRASFAAVVNARKVIVMAPTTVLAEQHYRNWVERFEHFPVEIRFISRFQSPQERKRIIEEFNEGKIDVLIGTHAVLSRSIDLRDVGLVIVDEEHRFGVNQKEIFKARKPEIDVLMLSATPIPRTLQMALTGIKPVSLIETPPPGRLPVVTHIGEYDETLVINAVKRELERDGQSIYVCNDIERLPSIASFIQQRISDAKVAVAHGQMPEKRLEKTMVDFWEGKHDVLVSTTIIESGLDMPNVNTIIVEGVERLGLAQAYQLKGRVGRSYRQAFAYFLFSRKVLTEKEEKRLKALLELSGWGGGYRLALKDLEIRGAGNLLGPEQHGHMMRVGVNYFMEMIRTEIEKIKTGKEEARPKELTIEIPVNIYIPDSYISSLKLKYEVYRKAAFLKSMQELKNLRSELQDRFGEPPKEVDSLLYYGLIRNLAKKARINTIRFVDGTLTLRSDGPGEKLVKSSRLLKGAQARMNAVQVKVKKQELLRFLYSVLVDIISKTNIEGSK
jgi:transcription-repair coupling factor (superfamily II helicase)